MNNKEPLTIKFEGKIGEIFKKLKDVGYIKVGILGKKKNKKNDKVTVAYYGSVHEFGYPPLNIPQRSFLRKPLKAFLPQYLEDNIVGIIKSIESGKEEETLNKIGTEARNIVLDAFRTRGVNGEWKKLSDITIKRKGVDTPLIDTHALIQSIDYKVIKEKR